MCLFAALYRVVPGCPLLILSNREESAARAAEPPRSIRLTENCTRWLGGVDRRAGGTWLGLNEHGLLVGVTNRAKRDVPPGVRSRGLLCRDLLGCTSTAAALEECRRQREAHEFAGFNLLLFSRDEAVVVEAGNDFQEKQVSAGVHGVTNGAWNDPADARLHRALSAANAALDAGGGIELLAGQLERIAALPADETLPAICLHGEGWGTVSSTVIALADDPALMRYRYAPGPPDQVGFDDYSHLLCELLRAAAT